MTKLYNCWRNKALLFIAVCLLLLLSSSTLRAEEAQEIPASDVEDIEILVDDGEVEIFENEAAVEENEGPLMPWGNKEEGEAAYCTVSYKFVSGTEGRGLPSQVNNYLPTKVKVNGTEKDLDGLKLASGDKLEPVDPSKKEITVQYADGETVYAQQLPDDNGAPITKVKLASGGTWYWQGWDNSLATMTSEGVVFTGTWIFEAMYDLTYDMNGGGGEQIVDPDAPYLKDEVFQVFDGPTPPAGKYFKCWREVREDGSPGQEFYPGHSYKMPQRDLVLRAEWTTSMADEAPSVSYQAKIIGSSSWQSAVKNGAQAGTTGQSKIMEAFKIQLVDDNNKQIDASLLGVEYCGHIQNIGWDKWVSNNTPAGRPGQGLRIEALKLRLTGELKDQYDIYYCLHCQNYGWLGWAKNGEESGTAGMALRVEAICVQILPKGSLPPAKFGNYTETYMYSPEIFYTSYVQGQGWQKEVRKKNVSGTSGKSLRLEGFKIRVSGEKNLGVRYKGHVQNVGWMDWVKDGAVCGQPGKSRRIEALQLELTGADKDKYDIYYCLHVQNFGWLAWAKNGQKSGSSGVSMRVEAYVIRILPKGSPKPKNLGSRTETFIDGVGATKLTLNKTKASVKKGKTISLSATILPANRTFKGVTWKSSNTAVATVSGGIVTGKKKGTATITCTSNDGRVKATCVITVT